MGFFNEIGTIILSFYMALTGGVADYLNNFLTPPIEDTKQPITDISTLSNSQRFIPRILLDNQGFQQAAVLASKQKDSFSPEIEDAPLEELVKDALVNIYCQYKTPEYIRTTTGSGYFINEKGVIITNAHVAQFLLLEERNNHDIDVECIIRNGDPASPKYEAELLYISPVWIYENADLITDETPRGTGERDYALLYISKSIDGSPLPTRFPAIPTDTELLAQGIAGEKVVTAGYPADELLKYGANANLPLVFASSSVGLLYTFGSNYADIFSITESAVGSHGASGGPIVRNDTKHAIGLIVTKGDEETEGSRSLRALTLSYIDRTMKEETGYSLQENMKGDVALRGNIFKDIMTPLLAEILEEEIE